MSSTPRRSRTDPPSGAQRLSRRAVAAFARREKDRYERLLRRFVECPTVSADPARRDAIARGVALAARTLRGWGGRVRVHRPRGGHPVVIADFGALGGAPVLLYNHLDVQPASDRWEPWRTPPFTLVRRGARWYGRGTTDDKGPALAALFGLRALHEAGRDVAVRVVWEFSEEIGSPGLESCLRRVARRPPPRVAVVSDTVWLSDSRPATPVVLRGFQGFRFLLRTGDSDRHSGDYGGAARNPHAELMQVMMAIHDPRTGEVTIPGFYDDVEPVTRRMLRDFDRSRFPVRAWAKGIRLRVRSRRAILRRIWARPTFDIHGVAGGYTGPGIKSVVPGWCEVKASCRLVPRQSPRRVLRLVRDHVRRVHPGVRVIPSGASEVFDGAEEGPPARALDDAYRFGFGRAPARIRDGGSIGAAVAIRAALGCPVVFLGISQPRDGYHAPNESFAWRQAEGGIAAFARFLETFSSDPGAPRPT